MRFSYVRGRPVVFLRLSKADKDSNPLDVLLDSGATLSVFPSGLARPLGIDLGLIEPVKATAANDTDLWYRPAEVTLRLAHSFNGMFEVIEWRATVGFAEECKSGVLGHRECLEYFDTCFFGYDKSVSIVPNDGFLTKFPMGWSYIKNR